MTEVLANIMVVIVLQDSSVSHQQVVHLKILHYQLLEKKELEKKKRLRVLLPKTLN